VLWHNENLKILIQCFKETVSRCPYTLHIVQLTKQRWVSTIIMCYGQYLQEDKSFSISFKFQFLILFQCICTVNYKGTLVKNIQIAWKYCSLSLSLSLSLTHTHTHVKCELLVQSMIQCKREEGRPISYIEDRRKSQYIKQRFRKSINSSKIILASTHNITLN
jgi:hypothetical protein